MRKILMQSAILRRTYYRYKHFRGSTGQSDETNILAGLITETSAPKTFVEFGFHPVEFNCAGLVSDFDGLLIDGNARRTEDAAAILPSNIHVVHRFLAIDNLDIIRNRFKSLGVLSIDVDGNDYWFLESLLDIAPSIIVVEYNASFGTRSVTVPYDPRFDRSQKHPTGWYHGASLPALAGLARRHGYGLAAVSGFGGNAFFTKTGALDAVASWRPNTLREAWSGKSADQQWDAIKDMPLIEV